MHTPLGPSEAHDAQSGFTVGEATGKAHLSSKTPRILVVDDETHIRVELLDMLTDEGLDAVEAADARDALNLIDSDESIGLVFTDLRMPGMTGIEMVSELKRRYDDTRPIAVVILTGHGGLDDAVEALQYGVVDFVTKPFDFPRTENAIKKALKSWRKKKAQHIASKRLSTTVSLQGDEIDRLSLDVAERQLEIEAANRARERFLRDMRGTLSAPLQDLKSVLRFMSERHDELAPGELEEWVRSFEKATEQLTSHLNTIMEVANVDAVGTDLHETTFAPLEVCVRAAWLFGDKAQKDGIEISVSSHLGDALVCADRSRFLIALGCVLDHSVTRAPHDSQISVTLAYDPVREGWINVTVRDDGPGMTSEGINNTLNPHRPRSSRAAEPPLEALSLYLAKRNIDLNGGSLRVKNHSLGGLEVLLRLPLHDVGSGEKE